MTPDYELWYALIEDDRRKWPLFQLTVPAESLGTLLAAAKELGVSTAEFIELAVRERLAADPQEWWEEFYAERLKNGPEPCFFCGEPAEFIDYCYEAPFCNSGICNWAINEDLRMNTVPA